MFVYNIKVNSNKIFKLIFVLILLISLAITGIAIYKTFIKNGGITVKSDDVYTITSNNYTNVLKAVHDNLDNYIGQKISFVGYVYRVYDLKEDEFVLARDMVLDSKNQTLIVGFLCHSSNANDFEDGSWVNITGEIKKGYYHGDIPIIEITKIEKASKPKDYYVYPPDDTYIPTSSLLYNNP